MGISSFGRRSRLASNLWSTFEPISVRGRARFFFLYPLVLLFSILLLIFHLCSLFLFFSLSLFLFLFPFFTAAIFSYSLSSSFIHFFSFPFLFFSLLLFTFTPLHICRRLDRGPGCGCWWRDAGHDVQRQVPQSLWHHQLWCGREGKEEDGKGKGKNWQYKKRGIRKKEEELFM